MAPTFSNSFLSSFLLLLLILSPPCSSSSSTIQTNDTHLSQSSPPPLNFLKKQAKKLIRDLNLYPEHDINTGSGSTEDSLVDSPVMVEKSLRLPMLDDPRISIQDLSHHAGYYRLPHTQGARMFYFFFESRGSNSHDPVVLWLTGGPGCGSEVALFYENGPFHIANNLSLLWNKYGWDQASHIIYVDQPTGTGFSYSSYENDTRHDETGVSNDLYDFLQEFFKKHSQYAKNEFYITGESYAGHYIPATVARVNQGNKANEGIHINLKGFAIGNGLTDPAIQYKAYTDFALEMKLITQSDYSTIIKLVPPCEKAITDCGSYGGDSCTNAFDTCNSIFNDIMDITGGINYYDVRKECMGSMCYDFSNMENLMNNETVKDALGVGKIEFVSCSSIVYDAMLTDWMRNLEVVIPALLEDGIKMLVYAGEYDLICNWLGNSRWVHAMVWSGQKNFNDAPTIPFVVDGKEKGQMKSYETLTFLKVHDAGHMVPMDQPQAALEMLSRWTQGRLSVPEFKVGLGPM